MRDDNRRLVVDDQDLSTRVPAALGDDLEGSALGSGGDLRAAELDGAVHLQGGRLELEPRVGVTHHLAVRLHDDLAFQGLPPLLSVEGQFLARVGRGAGRGRGGCLGRRGGVASGGAGGQGERGCCRREKQTHLH